MGARRFPAELLPSSLLGSLQGSLLVSPSGLLLGSLLVFPVAAAFRLDFAFGFPFGFPSGVAFLCL